MNNKEDKEWLYGKLKDNGLSISYEDFDKTLSNDEDRKWYYERATGMGLEVGSYDDFSKLFGFNDDATQQRTDAATKPQLQPNRAGAAPAETEQSLEPVTRQTLRQQVEGANGFHIPTQAEMRAKVDPNGNMYPDFAENIRQAAGRGEFDAIINKEEEDRLDKEYASKPVATQGDIYQNYAERFSNTERGKGLGAELDSIRSQVSDKYAQEYLQSAGFQKLASRYRGDELDKAANEEFERLYGERIREEVQPYEEAYSKEVMSRYGSDIERESNGLVKREAGNQLDELSGKVENMIASRGQQLEKDSEGKWWRDLPRGGGGAVTTVNFASNQGRTFDPEYQQLQAASSLIDNSKDIINEASKKGNTNFVAGLGRGIRDSFNADNWSFGLTELAKNVNQVLDKADRNQPLTESEQALLDALVTNMAVNAYYSSDLGRGYKAGQTTGASIPFMLEFALNPVSASGSSIAKGLLRYGARRFGLASARGAARKAALTGARLIGDASAAAAMTGTTGAARVAGEAQERMRGDVDIDFGEDGRAEYAGRANQAGAAEAIGKSFASTFLENQSEMIFNAFPGIGSRIAEALPGGMPGVLKSLGNTRMGQSVRQFYREMKNNPTLREIAQRTQFHGLGEEYMEEVYNNFASIPLGDMTLEDAVSIDNNIDTFLGLAPTSVAFGMLGLAGMARERYNNRRNMRRVFGKFTPEQQRMFNELQQMSRENGNEDIKNFIKITIEDPELTQEQKRDKIQYAWEIARSNAIDEIQEEEIQEQVDAENADIDAHTDPKTNTYTEMDRLEMDGTGEYVRVPGHKTGEIGGMPVWVEEGKPNTEENRKTLKPGEWDESTVRSMPADEVKAENEAMIREEAAAQAERESMYSPDIPPLQLGSAFTSGNATYEVVQQNPDGGWVARKTSVDEKGNRKEEVVPIDEQTYMDFMQSNIDAEEAAREQARQPQAEVTLNNDIISSATPKDYMKANPSIVEGYITAHPEQVQVLLNDEAQKAADYLNGKTDAKGYLSSMGYLDSYLNGASEEEISGMAKEISDRYRPYLNINNQNGQVNSVNSSENESRNEVSPSDGQSNVSEPPVHEQQPEMQDEPVQQPQAEAQDTGIPTDDEGNPVYYRAPVDVTVRSISSEGLEPEEVDAFIEANQREADKNLKKVQDKAPKMGTSIAAYKKAKAEWQEKVADAQAQSDYWKQVKDEVAASRIRPGDTVAEEIIQLGEPLNGEEFAAMMLGNGNLPLLRESYMQELGVGNSESQGLFGLFASKERGGMTVAEAGDRLMEADRENGTNFFDRNDPNAGRNAIIGVLSGARTRGDLTQYIRRSRERTAERERQAEYAAYEQWCEENFHMTPEEYESYMERLERESPFEGVDVSEIDAIFAEAAEEYGNYSRRNDAEKTEENGTENGNVEGGGTVLPKEQAGNAGGNPRVAEPGQTEATGGEDAGDDAASQEGASGRIEDVLSTDFPEMKEGENLLDYAERVAKNKEIDDARQQVEANPTDAQKEAGNYKKGHITLDGYDITIENPKGSVRSGTDADGNPWSVTMNNDYGYIRGTEGVDGDHIDVFLSDDPTDGDVYVIDQMNPETGGFDEHKVMYGFKSALAAKRAYLANYSPDWKGLGAITKVSKEEFKKWVESSRRKTKPFAEYKNVNKANVTNEPNATEDRFEIAPAQYTTKRGKVLDMFLVKFAEPLTKEQQRAAKEIAKSEKGWYDRDKGVFMMRSEESARKLADTITGNEEAVSDAQPLSLSDTRKLEEPVMRQVNVEGLMQATQENGEAKLSDHLVPQSEQNEGNAYGANNKLVSRERYEQLKARMRRKLGGQLNMGIDPEILAIGTEMAAYHIEAGARKFADYVTHMIADLGDAIRPYLKSFYNGARDLPEVQETGLSNEMTPYDEVRTFDVANFDKDYPDALATAEMVVQEQEADRQADEAKDKLIEQRNEQRKKTITLQKGQPDLFAGLYEDGEAGLSGHSEELAIPKERPASELSGNSEETQRMNAQKAAFAKEISDAVNGKIAEIERGMEPKPLSMADIRRMLGSYDALANLSDTGLQELVEMAMTFTVRGRALESMNGTEEEQRAAYEYIVNAYRMQPNLSARDSERLMKQQYSTPLPLGYVMGQFVQGNGKAARSVLEPSAGNGALTITFDTDAVHVNDIDLERLDNLRKLGFGKVTSQDALIPFADSNVDAVVTNPPFGTVSEKVYEGIFRISSLEAQMAINALDSMSDGGRAAIVIGGNTSYRKNGSMNPKDAAFFGYLYSRYNVVDVINVSGKKLYSRNGTGYDVRIILIDGRKPGEFKRVYPPVRDKARAGQVTTFDELYKRIQDDIRIQQMGNQPSDGMRKPQGNTDGKTGEGIVQERDRAQPGERGEPVQPGGNVRPSSPVRVEWASGAGNGRAAEQQQEQGSASGMDNGNGRNEAGAGDVQRADPGKSGQGERDRGEGSGGRRAVRPDIPDSGNSRDGSGLAVVSLTDEKVPYPQQSGNGFNLMSVVPSAQAHALQESLGNIGDVDAYLVEQLGYSGKQELYSYLAAEQIDSVALAIRQMEGGNAFIIGDMTGVGKGRQGAALIRYAVRKGKETGKSPVYFTQKPSLFSDNYRDLVDIGSPELRPFIMSSSSDGKITDAEGNTVYRIPTKKETERVFGYIRENGKLPPEYDYVLTTYSQIQNGTKDYEATADGWASKDRSPAKGKSFTATDISGQQRRDILEILAKDGFAILDESHTVGGDSGCGRYMQMLTGKASGVTFLSATFAKRADNMPIYAQKTAISEAGVKANELIEAIAKGGVTLQEIMSKQLVESGQMIRRERSFEGVTIDWMSVAEEEDRKQRERFNEVSRIFNAIRAFQNDYVTPVIETMNENAAETGGMAEQRKGTKDVGVSNVPFASKMYNLVNQLLFALKAESVANRVIWNLQNGFKPVISFTNTMEGFLEDAPRDTEMDELPNFSLTLLRALDGVMRYTRKDADGNSEGNVIPLSMLSPEGRAEYNRIQSFIMNMSADLPISPMDFIRMRIEEAGYSVSEITGRTLCINRTGNGKYVVGRRQDTDKKAAARDFNSGKVDVLMINKSGSTGISLHSSTKFADQRQRVMVFAQFQQDINDEVQMRGRIDRTGQVSRGKYEYIVSTIPAEQRIQMMFKAKLKSLDANTTSSQKSKFNEMEITDYLNKYGDEVVYQYMMEHPELEESLGDPLKILSAEEGGVRDNNEAKQDCAGKISRYLAFLPVEQQEEIFRDITEAYKVKMQLLDDAGENDLEITSMPLRAETKSRKVWHEGKSPGSGNAFADSTYLEEVEADVLKKPMKLAEVKAMQKRLAGESYREDGGRIDWAAYVQSKEEEVRKFYGEKADESVRKLRESGKPRIEKAREKALKDLKAAREKGKNTYTDEDIARIAEESAEEVREKEAERQEKRRNGIISQYNRISRVMHSLRPDIPLIVPMNVGTSQHAQEGMFTENYGTFVGFKWSKDYSPSSSTAVFATLDGRRKVELPLNSTGIEAILKSTSTNWTIQPEAMKAHTVDKWDSNVPAKTRQKRYIITGNLLQALVDTQKSGRTSGNLISYSTIDGDTRQGILMNEGFKPSDLRNSAPISSRLQQIKNGETVVSEDGDVTVEREQREWRNMGDYALIVPKSKLRGGKYTMDKTLLSFVKGNNFNTRGNNMVGHVIPENLSKVLDLLSREPFNVTVLEESKLGEGGGARFRSVRRSGVRKGNEEDIVSAVASLTERLNTPVHIIRSVEDLPEGLPKRRIEAGENIKGWYQDGEVIIYLPNAASVDDAVRTVLHETVGHKGLRQLIGEERFDGEMLRLFGLLPESVRDEVALNAVRSYGGNVAVAMDEYLAEQAERDVTPSWWDRVVSAVRGMLRRIGVNVRLTGNDVKYLLWRSRRNLEEGNLLDLAEDVSMRNGIRFRKTPDGEAYDGSREAYNDAVSGSRFKAQEAYQDSMLALKRLQEVVEKFSGKPIQSFENAYMAENHMSSKNTREKEVYGEKFFKPMVAEIGNLIKKGASYGSVIDYMIAKHGLERNEAFAKRDADLQTGRKFADRYSELDTLLRNEAVTEEEYEERKDRLDTERDEYHDGLLAGNLERDYSGLTALAEKHGSEPDAFKAHAEEVVADFEGKYDTDSLWEKVNAATKETLRKSYESGMMSRDTYNKVVGMFKNYIPLRGWDEETAEDVYEYLNSETSPVSSVLKSAKGRRSLADDPIAVIGNMAESSIHQGNRNLMKQNFLNMAINHPTDVLTVKEAWYVKDTETGGWKMSFPDIKDGDSADTVAGKVEEHERRMKELEGKGEATKVKEGLNIDYRIGSRQAREHIVNVKRNGKDYLVFVNGNPRAAQAVNGLTNPNAEENKMLAGISRFNRELAANFTNRNPAFVLSNLTRDLIFSVSAVSVKESPEYSRKFAKNIMRSMRVIARNLRGKGDPQRNPDDALFEEFLANGGETGYTMMHSVDEYKKMVKRELGKKGITGKTDYFSAVRACAQFFSTMNRWAEDVSRFTAYMTSKESGRPVMQSVNDAKEVTVNFNRRGAGPKTSGVFGWTSGMFRNFYLFFNAGIQSLYNFGRLAKKNPKAFATALAGFTAAGFMVPVLNGLAIAMLGDGDDDYYGNLPEWVRRNNLCIYAGFIPGMKGKFLTIPLPIELRAFYGLGELAYQETVGGEGSDGSGIAYKAINQLTELLPLNPLGNNGDIAATVMPDVLSPIWQAYENKDFTGKPIYRENPFNETMPEWTKAYDSTADWLVDLSEWTNEIAGGDKYKRGELPMSNWNPAIVEHLFESYFGGMAKTFNQTAKTLAGGAESAVKGEWSDNLQWYSTPVLNRFINDASDDRSSFGKVNQRYYKLYEQFEETGKLIRGYSNEVSRGNLDYLERLNGLYQSDDYKTYLVFKKGKRIVDRIREMEKKLPEGDSRERKALQEQSVKMKRSIIDAVESVAGD